MPLTRPQLRDVCLIHKGQDQCRYASPDDQAYNIYHCNKLTGQKKIVDAEVQKHQDDCKKKGMAIFSQGRAIGDNCKGYPYLPTIDQGYDLDQK